jgi:superfamily II DNA or RNA helicase
MDSSSITSKNPSKKPRYKSLVKAAPTNIRDPNFQNFLFDFFNRKLRIKPPKASEMTGTGDRCIQGAQQEKIKKTPFLMRPKMFMHQHVMSTISRIFAHNAANPNRGLLAWHSTGSGKTCTATAIMDAFWDTNREIVYVSSTEALASNPPENFYRCAMNFANRFRRRPYTAKTKQERLRKVEAAFQKRNVQFTTFAKLAHFLMIYKPLKSVKDVEYHKNFLNNAIIIIDEVQNIFKPLQHQKGESRALRKFFLDPNNPYANTMKMVVLTATPGDTTEDLINLLNMVKDPSKPSIQAPNVNNPDAMTAFKEQVRGLVSFFDMSGDDTRFPRVIDQNKMNLPMSREQFEEYVKASNTENHRFTSYEKLSDNNQQSKYFNKSRRYSNMMYQPQNYSMETFSSKLPKLLEMLGNYSDEKHYVYSSFYTKHGYGGQGIHAIAKTLKKMGYKQLRPSEIVPIEQMSMEKRFVLATNADLTMGSTRVGAAGANLKKLLSVYNNIQNKNGEYVQVFLASQGFNEGVDLKHVRHVHIFDPLLTGAAERQTIGRAARYCSHSGLDRDSNKWTVKIHRYYSDKPLDLTIYNMEPYQTLLLRKRDEELGAKERLEALQGVRGKAADRDNLKKQIASIQREIKEVVNKLKELENMNVENRRMIDHSIASEAAARDRALKMVYKAVLETAVDCLVFKDFHALSGYDLACDSPAGTRYVEPKLQIPKSKLSKEEKRLKSKAKEKRKDKFKKLLQSQSPQSLV